MKKIITLILVLHVVTLSNAQAPDSWTEKSGFGLDFPAGNFVEKRYSAVSFSLGSKAYIGTGVVNGYRYNDFFEYDPAVNKFSRKSLSGGGPRSGAVSFSIGNKAYIGTGYNSISAYANDFWEYDPSTDVWTQKANFGGTARVYAAGFSIGNKAYIGTGTDGSFKNDFWEYDQGINVWMQKSNFSGTARSYATGFSIGNKGYIGMGYIGMISLESVNDFWEYDPSNDLWTQKSSLSTTGRQGAAGFSIGGLGYIGTGFNNITLMLFNDFWEYNPASNIWTQKAGFPGAGRLSAVGFNIGTLGYIGLGVHNVSPGEIFNDFYEYNPATDLWTQKKDFGISQSRHSSACFSIGNSGFIGTGFDGTWKNDFWQYDKVTNSWNQKANFSGLARSSATGFSIGNKGYLATGSNNNTKFKDLWEYDIPTDSWTQKADFAGFARPNAISFSIGNKGYLGTGTPGSFWNDFWEYDQVHNLWTQKANFGGGYREKAVGFSIGNKGYLGTGSDGVSENDFWEYDPAVNTWTQKANFAGAGRYSAIGFSLGNKGYVGSGTNSSVNFNDFWEYDQLNNSWTQRVNFPGDPRNSACGFAIGSNGYAGTGYTGGYNEGNKNDFWEYTPVCSTPVSTIYFSGNTSFCSGDSVFLYSNNGYTYQWKKNGVDITGATSYFYYAKSTGNYVCYLTNTCGTVTSTIISVTVNSLPSATITAGSSTTFCSGGSVILNAPVNVNYSYQWKKGANIISGATASSYTTTTGGNFRVIVTNTITGCSKTTGNATIVTVNALPTATITPQGPTTFCAGGSVVLQANTGTGLTYKWKKGSNYISGATLLNYTATTGGNYRVQVTNSNGCSKTSGSVTISVPCKEGEVISSIDNFGFTVYPNPNSGEFTINFSTKPTSSIQIELMDEIGNVVKKFETVDETIVIKQSNLAKGIYCLTVRNNDEVVMKKINVVP